MPIVDRHGEQVFPAPKRDPVLHVKSPKVRARNRRWLERRRGQDLSIRELARLVRKPPATVARGLKWAEQEEAREEERAAAAARSPVVDRASGLTADDVRYLVDTYGPGTDLGSLPQFWDLLAPLMDRVVGRPLPSVVAPPASPSPTPGVPTTFAELAAYRAA